MSNYGALVTYDTSSLPYFVHRWLDQEAGVLHVVGYFLWAKDFGGQRFCNDFVIINS